MRLIVLKGMTIVETLVVLSIISFIVISSLALLPIISEKQDITRAQKNLKLIKLAITEQYFWRREPNFSSRIIVKRLPQNISLSDINTALIKGVWGTINTRSYDSNRYYEIVYQNVPSTACTHFVQSTYKDHLKVSIAGVTLSNAASIHTLCSSTDEAKEIIFVNQKDV